ncbi:MAG: reverse transcriptase (RNA-dependent DNA polymerase)-domain-containing protein [Olpidium bornovanus]|uniref:Reverse transcriptase (RNA-dependent DNA polymerase)-domain-containing protein n=1 Tax=Olpidium bornovanus TaxID=278681 RepID=A0A8H7ZY53_9FUNG|nr:MAG: reverse transcriptase (RNA-dependent DNA polymerase)-domain-containing protein [Olpidium bornovanus]
MSDIGETARIFRVQVPSDAPLPDMIMDPRATGSISNIELADDSCTKAAGVGPIPLNNLESEEYAQPRNIQLTSWPSEASPREVTVPPARRVRRRSSAFGRARLRTRALSADVSPREVAPAKTPKALRRAVVVSKTNTEHSQPRLQNLAFLPLASDGHNYLVWCLNAKSELYAAGAAAAVNMGGKAEAAAASAPTQTKWKALILLRRHLDTALQAQYLEVEDPNKLWAELKSRFDHQQTVFLPRARHDWTHLRITEEERLKKHSQRSNQVTPPALLSCRVAAKARERKSGRIPVRPERGNGKGKLTGESNGTGTSGGGGVEKRQKYVETRDCNNCGRRGHLAQACRSSEYLRGLYKEVQGLRRCLTRGGIEAGFAESAVNAFADVEAHMVDIDIGTDHYPENTIKVRRMDNAKESASKSFEDFCTATGIEVQYSAPYEHWQNELAESFIKRIQLINEANADACLETTTAGDSAIAKRDTKVGETDAKVADRAAVETAVSGANKIRHCCVQICRFRIVDFQRRTSMTPDPRTVVEAMRRPDWPKWKAPIEKEDNSPRRRGIFGDIARLVAQGFAQRAGIDYEETYSPVMDAITSRYLNVLAVQLHLEIFLMDVVTAYLYGGLDVDSYMKSYTRT